MKIVSVAPRRHLLQSARAIVPPRGDSREFILSADCLIWGWELYAVFDEKHIAEWGNLDLMFRWTQPSSPHQEPSTDVAGLISLLQVQQRV